MALSFCLFVCLSHETRTCRALAWLVQQRSSAGGCERPQRCWASQASSQHNDGGGGLSYRLLGLHWLVSCVELEVSKKQAETDKKKIEELTRERDLLSKVAL